MSLNHGGSIPLDGLVLYIDSKNPKCWRGAPTTNVCLMDGQNGVNPWAGDGTGLVVGGNHPDIMFRGKKVVQLKLGSAGNLYLNGGADLLTSLTSTQWTSTVYLRRLDGAPLPSSIGRYAYISGNTNVNTAATPTQVEDGWVKVNYTRTGLTAGYPSLIGCYGIGAGVDLLIANWQMEPLPYESRYVFGTRSNTQSLLDLKSNAITVNSLTCINDEISFNGTTDYITLPSDVGITDSFTQSAWFKSTGTPAGGYHIIFGGGESELSIPTSGQIRTGVTTSTRYINNFGSGLLDGTWHMVSMVFDRMNLSLYAYINGIKVGTVITSSAYVPASHVRTVGQFGSNATYKANGIIDQIMIYNRPLSDSEILSLFNSTRGRYGM